MIQHTSIKPILFIFLLASIFLIQNTNALLTKKIMPKKY